MITMRKKETPCETEPFKRYDRTVRKKEERKNFIFIYEYPNF